MNAGIPGLGISGLFFILSVIFMPLHKLLKRPNKHHQRWSFVAKITFINLLIISMVVLTAGIVGLIMHHPKSTTTLMSHTNQLIEVARIAMPFILLVIVLTSLMLVSQLLRRRVRGNLKPVNLNFATQPIIQPKTLSSNIKKPTPRKFFIHDITPRNFNRPNLSKSLNRYIHKPSPRIFYIHDITPRKNKYTLKYNRPSLLTSEDY